MTDPEKSHGIKGRRKSAVAGNLAERCLAQSGRKIGQNRRLSPARKLLSLLHYWLSRKQRATVNGRGAVKKQPKSLRTVTLPV